LEEWFRQHGRDLPWRRRRSPWGTLVSEAMLQQTQVSRVVERYQTFMDRFADPQSLARADEQQVLALWAGLGYYRRARHLHAAAKAIVAQHGGKVPSDPAALQQLPGVGRYTAGAVASLAFNRAAPIVDGNVQRVLARWHARHEPPETTVGWSWQRAGQLVEQTDNPGVLNEALMELGATVCTPKSPACETCPVAKWCAAHRAGRAQDIPPPKRRAPRLVVHHHVVVIRRGRRLLLEQRPQRGLWASMWSPPAVESPRRLRRSQIESGMPVSIADLQHAGAFEHQTTHRRIQFHVYTASSRARRGVWRAPDELDDLPMSNAHKKVLAATDTQHSTQRAPRLNA
jgi:A/G-specific adenine glycosylase